MNNILEELKNAKADKEHTLDEVIEILQMMRDSTETNIKNKELFEIDDKSEIYIKGKYEGLAVALILVKSIKG